MNWSEEVRSYTLWSERTGGHAVRVNITRFGPMFRVQAIEHDEKGEKFLDTRWYFRFKEAETQFHGLIWEYADAEDYTF